MSTVYFASDLHFMKGFSQKEICKLCGYSPSGLSQIIKKKGLRLLCVKDNI